MVSGTGFLCQVVVPKKYVCLNPAVCDVVGKCGCVRNVAGVSNVS